MDFFSSLIEGVARALSFLGLTETARNTLALGLLLLLASAVVLGFAFVLMRRKGAPPGTAGRADSSVVHPSQEAESEEAETTEGFEETGAVETAAPIEPATFEAPAEEEVPGVEEIAPPLTAVPPPAAVAPVEAVSAGGVVGRLKAGLAKTHTAVMGRIDALLGSAPRIDADFLEELEEILITSDFGMKMTRELIDALAGQGTKSESVDKSALLAFLRSEVSARLARTAVAPWNPSAASPFVIMVVGVNGVGKTTTIGKLAAQFAREGKRVLVGAGDTFRAAAAEQLSVWAERAGAELIRHKEGADPAAVAFDAAQAAVARGADILILDTAGRLHTKVNLMEELKKIRRVLNREIPGAPHETLLVLDATTGQNALVQARLFQEAVEVSGVVLSKLDGTAKGGIVVAIGAELSLPVRFVGIGEGVDDLRAFAPESFVEALFEKGERP